MMSQDDYKTILLIMMMNLDLYKPKLWSNKPVTVITEVVNRKDKNDDYFGSSNVGFVFGSFLPSPAGFAVLSSEVNNSRDISTFP